MRLHTLCFLSMAAAAAFTVRVPTLEAQESGRGPSLPLPEVTESNIRIPEWRGGYPLANSMRAWHYNPGLVMPMVELGRAAQDTTLAYDLQMMVAAVVSSRNGCRYCLCSSARALNGDGSADSLMIALQRSIGESGFDEKTKTALLLAEQLTIRPDGAAEAVRAVVRAGWSDREAAQIVFFVSYMNMMNRIAQAFDLPPDASHPYDPDGVVPMLRCP